uniref:Uncharacterized protein n=1 Tax=Ditylenchus dipsaci TaxID=166011 RepID=A0A915DKV9_9BILA
MKSSEEAPLVFPDNPDVSTLAGSSVSTAACRDSSVWFRPPPPARAPTCIMRAVWLWLRFYGAHLKCMRMAKEIY